MDEFERIYQETLSKVNMEDLERARRGTLKQYIIIILLVLAFIVVEIRMFIKSPDVAIMLWLATPVFLGVLAAGLIILAKRLPQIIIGRSKPITGQSYKKQYKQTLIRTFVNTYNHDLDFDSSRAIDMESYNLGMFEGYDRFKSNDLVFGKLAGKTYIEIGDVLTEQEHETEDENGNVHTSYSTLFKGLYGRFTLPISIQNVIKITTDPKFPFKKDKENVQMDSGEFEKYFDVSSNDKILVMRILTSDVMDTILKFKNTSDNFQITINNNHVCIRIPCNNLFETSVTKSADNKELLKEDYKYLNFIYSLSQSILNALENKDI